METAALPQFRRPHHRRIARLLRAFDAELLAKAECYFGGGTAITLHLDEYRESVDIDFLCSSQEGFRMLRSVVGSELGPLLKTPTKHARDIISNQYKILTFLEMDGVKIKVEFIREGNTQLTGMMDASLGVPALSQTDLWSQKLMANADRALDKSTMSRDIIDLAMMLRGWGPMPRAAFDKAYAAYGDAITRGFNNAMGVISDAPHLKHSMEHMGMDTALVEEIVLAIDDASAALPLSPVEQAEYDRRVANMPELAHSDGAPYLLWKAATEAASHQKGTAMNWAQVERSAMIDGVESHGKQAQEMADVIARFSPSGASTSRTKALTMRALQQGQHLAARPHVERPP